MKIDYEIVGVRIRNYRKSQHITQEELAFQIQTSAAYVSNIEAGKKKPSLQKLCDISEVLHITLNDLIYSPKHAKANKRMADYVKLNSICTPENRALIHDITELIERMNTL